ncbi:MAG: hypothetical protein IH598_16845 [Bacteroidales bacterium]|nr:hypothetical protein [Bacteroidales bacterium]
MSHHKLENLKGRHADAFADIPANYFEDLPGKIMAGIEEHKDQSGKSLGRYTRFGIAAGFLVLIGLSVFLFFRDGNGSSSQQITERIKEVVVPEDTTAGIVDLKDQLALVVPYDTNFNPDEQTVETSEMIDPFAELGEIPLEALMEYLNEWEEFEF